jgi:ribokinase
MRKAIQPSDRNVFVFGSLNMDLSLEVAELPDKGATVAGKNLLLSPGGKGANQAVALAKAGARTFLYGAVGTDGFGEELLRHAQSAHVETAGVQKLAGASGMAVVLLHSHDNRIIISGGANEKVTASLADDLLAKTQSGDILVSQFEVSKSAVAQVFAKAKKKGVFTLLNPTPVSTMPVTLWGDTDLLVLNENECAFYSGILPGDESGVKSAFVALKKKGTRALLVTLGSKGSVYCDDFQCFFTKAFPVDALDTTGAGDTYIGYFAAVLSRGASIENAMKIASAASGLACTKRGAQPAMPSLQETLNFLSSF